MAYAICFYLSLKIEDGDLTLPSLYIFPASITGESVTIGFNNKFALDALRASECDKIKIQLSGSMKVIKMLPVEGEDFIFLLMPIQLR